MFTRGSTAWKTHPLPVGKPRLYSPGFPWPNLKGLGHIALFLSRYRIGGDVWIFAATRGMESSTSLMLKGNISPCFGIYKEWDCYIWGFDQGLMVIEWEYSSISGFLRIEDTLKMLFLFRRRTMIMNKHVGHTIFQLLRDMFFFLMVCSYITIERSSWWLKILTSTSPACFVFCNLLRRNKLMSTLD